MKRSKTIHNQQYSDLISRLCLERKRLGLSQSEVAKQLGMHQSEVSKIETLERRVDVFEFKELIRIYRIQENAKLNKLVTDFMGLEK